jgi:hypothetical protein
MNHGKFCKSHKSTHNQGKGKLMNKMEEVIQNQSLHLSSYLAIKVAEFKRTRFYQVLNDDRGDVPGWVLVVLMTTGLVTAIWTIAAPRLSAILKNSLDAMNGIR